MPKLQIHLRGWIATRKQWLSTSAWLGRLDLNLNKEMYSVLVPISTMTLSWGWSLSALWICRKGGPYWHYEFVMRVVSISAINREDGPYQHYEFVVRVVPASTMNLLLGWSLSALWMCREGGPYQHYECVVRMVPISTMKLSWGGPGQAVQRWEGNQPYQHSMYSLFHDYGND
jgi:hypothetical protein